LEPGRKAPPKGSKGEKKRALALAPDDDAVERLRAGEELEASLL